MMKYIKQIPKSNYRPILLSLIISVAYLTVPGLMGASKFEGITACVIFGLTAGLLFLAALCDVLKSVIDSASITVIRR